MHVECAFFLQSRPHAWSLRKSNDPNKRAVLAPNDAQQYCMSGSLKVLQLNLQQRSGMCRVSASCIEQSNGRSARVWDLPQWLGKVIFELIKVPPIPCVPSNGRRTHPLTLTSSAVRPKAKPVPPVGSGLHAIDGYFEALQKPQQLSEAAHLHQELPGWLPPTPPSPAALGTQRCVVADASAQQLAAVTVELAPEVDRNDCVQIPALADQEAGHRSHQAFHKTAFASRVWTQYLAQTRPLWSNPYSSPHIARSPWKAESKPCAARTCLHNHRLFAKSLPKPEGIQGTPALADCPHPSTWTSFLCFAPHLGLHQNEPPASRMASCTARIAACREDVQKLREWYVQCLRSPTATIAPLSPASQDPQGGLHTGHQSPHISPKHLNHHRQLPGTRQNCSNAHLVVALRG